MADFRSSADDLDQRQPLSHASFASLDDDDNDLEKDEAIPIAPSIDDANVELENIAVVHAPPPPLPYTGAVVPFLGGECPLSSPNMLSAFELATVPPQKTASQLKWPRRHPCCRNRPWAPNPLGEAIPSHPQPMMGGTSTPTTTHLTSARANNRDHRSNMSSPSLPPMTLPSPSHQPFTIEGGNSPYSGGGLTDSFRDTSVTLPPQKCSRRKHRPCRVCWRHGPRAPNLLESLCGRRHRPRASNITPEAS